MITQKKLLLNCIKKTLEKKLVLIWEHMRDFPLLNATAEEILTQINLEISNYLYRHPQLSIEEAETDVYSIATIMTQAEYDRDK